jgi:hypothetical protein
MRTPDTTRLEHPTGLKSSAVEEEDPAIPISHATGKIVGEYGALLSLLKICERLFGVATDNFPARGRNFPVTRLEIPCPAVRGVSP